MAVAGFALKSGRQDLDDAQHDAHPDGDPSRDEGVLGLCAMLPCVLPGRIRLGPRGGHIADAWIFGATTASRLSLVLSINFVMITSQVHWGRSPVEHRLTSRCRRCVPHARQGFTGALGDLVEVRRELLPRRGELVGPLRERRRPVRGHTIGQLPPSTARDGL